MELPQSAVSKIEIEDPDGFVRLEDARKKRHGRFVTDGGYLSDSTYAYMLY
jgi:hypothetical protein